MDGRNLDTVDTSDRMHGPEGVDYFNRVEYLEVVKPERLVYNHSGQEDMSNSFQTTVTFEDRNGKTFLTLRAVLATAAERDLVVKEHDAIEGGKQTLARLAEYLVGM